MLKNLQNKCPKRRNNVLHIMTLTHTSVSQEEQLYYPQYSHLSQLLLISILGPTSSSISVTPPNVIILTLHGINHT